MTRFWPMILAFVVFSGGCKTPGGTWGQGDAVCSGARCVRVKLAKTSSEREQGLKFIRSMPADAGMLFLFEFPGRHDFWMKETLIPLDMIWLDDQQRVIYIAADVPPCTADPCASYGPDQDSHYVLELNAGQARSLGLSVGGKLSLQLRDSQR